MRNVTWIRKRSRGKLVKRRHLTMGSAIWSLIAALFIVGYATCQGTNDNETEALLFLEKYNTDYENITNSYQLIAWIYYTNITGYNGAELNKISVRHAGFQKDMCAEALQFNRSAMSKNVKRQLEKISDIGTSIQPNVTKVREQASVMSQMRTIYQTAKVCLTPDTCLAEGEITRLLKTTRDYDTLLTLWSGWRNETGKKMRDLYPKYVELTNDAVQFLGFKDNGESWRSAFESDTFVDDVKDLLEQVRPLYEQLHAYVRRRLKAVYGASRFPQSGHIPAHLLGNIWAQMWDNIGELFVPFANKTSMDVTKEMIRQNYTADKMFRTAEDFFVSLGFGKMAPTFWTKSMLKKPDDGRRVSCHPTAWDFRDRKDFRMMMCTEISHSHLMIIHHEIGHIQYYMEYKDQPVIYRDGANPGFHEAVGDVIGLSVQTPEHMHIIGLIDKVPTDKETDINFLMNMALQKVAFLPFGYLIDQWRWSVFSGNITPETYNKRWWDLRCRLQGVSPPIARSEEDFDPGSKLHVAIGDTYMKYFVSYILQFQLHQAACQVACYTGPLHRCDIYKSTQAGKSLRDMLKLGQAKPWQEALKKLTGKDKIDAAPLLEYFKPLMDFLRKENGNDFGWDPNCPVPT